MPTIDLADEQADDLRDLLEDRITYLTGEISRADPVEEVALENQRCSLADILDLLEIA